MKKILVLSVLAFLCSCGPSAEEKIKQLQKEKQKQLSKNENCIVEKISELPEYGIYKLTVDSSVYIFVKGMESMTIIKHK